MILQRLARLNPTAVFLGAAVLVFVGLLLPSPYGGLLLLALAAGLTWVLLRTWPMHDAGRRATRMVILGLLVALGVAKLL